MVAAVHPRPLSKAALLAVLAFLVFLAFLVPAAEAHVRFPGELASAPDERWSPHVLTPPLLANLPPFMPFKDSAGARAAPSPLSAPAGDAGAAGGAGGAGGAGDASGATEATAARGEGTGGDEGGRVHRLVRHRVALISVYGGKLPGYIYDVIKT